MGMVAGVFRCRVALGALGRGEDAHALRLLRAFTILQETAIPKYCESGLALLMTAWVFVTQNIPNYPSYRNPILGLW